MASAYSARGEQKKSREHERGRLAAAAAVADQRLAAAGSAVFACAAAAAAIALDRARVVAGVDGSIDRGVGARVAGIGHRSVKPAGVGDARVGDARIGDARVDRARIVRGEAMSWHDQGSGSPQ